MVRRDVPKRCKSCRLRGSCSRCQSARIQCCHQGVDVGGSGSGGDDDGGGGGGGGGGDCRSDATLACSCGGTGQPLVRLWEEDEKDCRLSCSASADTSPRTKSHTSHVTRHTSHVTRHTSHVTRHTSHVTRHTSQVTRHTSHVTIHKSQVTCIAICFWHTQV